MRFSYKLIPWALLCCPVVFAGNEVGNGGNSVVCPDKTELLDLYEAKVLRNQDADSTIKETDPYKIAAARLEMLSKLDSKSAKIFSKGVEILKKDLSLEKEIALLPVADSEHLFKPKDPKCRVEQLAVYRKKVLPGEKRVLVNEGIWKKLSPLHQAGLLLHEAIYFHLAQLGEKNSIHTRYLVSLFLSKEFATTDADNYWKKIKELRLPIYRPAK